MFLNDFELIYCFCNISFLQADGQRHRRGRHRVDRQHRDAPVRADERGSDAGESDVRRRKRFHRKRVARRSREVQGRRRAGHS